MTREEKIKAFEEHCVFFDDCDCCPVEKFKFCEGKNTKDFTDMELDLGLSAFGVAKKIFKNDGKNFDVVSRPKHYTSTSIECIDAMVETQGARSVYSFCLCNAFKYLWRHRSKNQFEDIKKASWYLNKAVELYEEGKCEN